VEFCRRYKGVIEPRWTSPDGTGYMRGLNLIPSLPPDQAERFETVILKKVDSRAAEALQKLLSDYRTPWDLKLRSAWTMFLLSVITRNPEAIDRAIRYMQDTTSSAAEKSRKLYDAEKGPHDPPFEEFVVLESKHSALQAILEILNNKQLGIHINKMSWTVHVLKNLRYPLMTSDRPLITTNGIGLPESYVVMPISPSAVFLAVNDPSALTGIQSLTHSEFAELVNLTVVNNAVKYVWATDESQLGFIRKHMSTNVGSDEWIMAGFGPKA
jgi:Protein of unknown function (DUF4238)